MFRKKKSKKLQQIPEIRMEVLDGNGEEGSSGGLTVAKLDDDEGPAHDYEDNDLGGTSARRPSLGVVGPESSSAEGGGPGKHIPPHPPPLTLLAKDSPAVSPCPSPTGPLSPLGPPSASPSASLCSVTFTGVMSDPAAVDSADAKDRVRFSNQRLSASSPAEDDEDYSASLDELLRRRGSGRRRSVRRSPKRGSSPMGSDSDRSRRRSSTMTSGSCDETAVSIEEPEMTEEQMFESIRLHKEVVDGMKKQPWRMKKRLLVVRQARAYVKKHEGELEQRLAQSKSTKDIMARYNIIFLRYWQRIKREAANIAKNLVPWEMRIKQIESHFGSVVASYFTFLRWVFWINIVMSVFIACFMMVPEVLATDRAAAGDRKELMQDEQASAFNLQKLWDFEGFLKYTPIFYGYYSNKDKTKAGYRLPFAYFMTSLGVYAYGFVAILRKMAENSRMSKLSDKDDECTFTWKLFTGWDYMIGASETAENKMASLMMGFKESILEERQKQEERNWRVIGMRVLANLIVLILLASSAYAVVLVVQRSKEPEADDNWWRQNETTVIVSLLSTLYPNLFDAIGIMEKFHPRVQLRWQLARILVLYLLNLYTLIFSLFSKVDEMSVKLFSLKPNTTAAPATTTPNPGFGGMTPASPSYFGPTFNDTDSPFANFSLATLLSALAINATGVDIVFSNATCVAFRAECVTGRAWPSQYDVYDCKRNSTTMPYYFLPNAFNSTSTAMSTTEVLEYQNVTYGGQWDDNMSLANYTFTQLQDGTWGNGSTDSPRSDALVYLPPHVIEKYNPDPSGYLKYNTSAFRLRLNPTTQSSSSTAAASTSRNSEGLRRSADPRPQSDSPVSTASWTLSQTDQSFPAVTREEESVNPWYEMTSWSPSEDFLPPALSAEGFGEYDGVRGWLRTISPNCCVVVSCVEDGGYPFRSSTPYGTDTGFTISLDEKGNITLDNVTESVYDVTNSAGLDFETRKTLRSLCWETMFGQELVKLTIMDIVFTTVSILITDFIRAVIVRVMNHCCCWDLEKQFPGYGDFKIAENILHLVNNQGMIWMGMFFAPGLPAINMVKLVLLMYIRSWAVLTCNIPHETVFRASRSNNFYYLLLLTMLFLCTLPVGYAIVWLDPSWHCGPFSQYSKIYQIFTTSIAAFLPDIISRALVYVASPGIIIPFLVLLILIIYYLISLSNSLRESNKDLKDQLRRERTEERKKVFQMADSRHDAPPSDADSKWTAMKKILPVLPSKVKMLHLAAQEMRQLAKTSAAELHADTALKCDSEKAIESGVPIGLVKAARLLSKTRGVALPQSQITPNAKDDKVANVHMPKSELIKAEEKSQDKNASPPKSTQKKTEDPPEYNATVAEPKKTNVCKPSKQTAKVNLEESMEGKPEESASQESGSEEKVKEVSRK